MPKTEDLITQPAASIRFKRLRLGILILGLLVVAAFAASSAYDAWRAHRNALAATDREIGNVAKALAEQTAWTWQGIDFLLRDTAGWYRNDSPKLPPERLDEVLAIRTAGVRQVRLITVVDAQGIQRHRSRGSSPPNFDGVGPQLLHRSAGWHRGGPLRERAADHPVRESRRGDPFAPAQRRQRRIRRGHHCHRRPRGSGAVLRLGHPRRGQRNPASARRRHAARAQPSGAGGN